MIKNEQSSMEYRRFGKTEEKISVITLGGMRYIKGWDKPRETVPKETLAHGVKITKLALDQGINHIETAWGYGNSEYNYGRILNDELNIPRKNYLLMTKGFPKKPEEVRPLIDDQLKALKTDYFDFYAWHGINNEERFDSSMATIEELLKLKEEGIIKHLGFSTHAQLQIICRAIETGYFDFVNLHYYYFFQRNHAAIQLAEARDMGVFIISPNDKGGQLWHPYPKLREMTKPLSPIQINAKFCLRTPAVHTLSFGFTEHSHFEEMKGIFPISVPLNLQERLILDKMNQAHLSDNLSEYEGYDLQADPSGINIPEILRMRRMWKCYEMDEYLHYRYNMFRPADNWFTGEYPTPDKLEEIDMSKVPTEIPLKTMLTEVHQQFYQEKNKNTAS